MIQVTATSVEVKSGAKPRRVPFDAIVAGNPQSHQNVDLEAGTIRVSDDGLWLVTAALRWQPDPEGTRSLSVFRGDRAIPSARASVPGEPRDPALSFLAPLAAGDRISFRVGQDSNSSPTLELRRAYFGLVLVNTGFRVS